MKKLLKNALAVKLLLTVTLVTAIVMLLAAVALHVSFREEQQERYRQLANNTMSNIDTVFDNYVESTMSAAIQWYQSPEGKLCCFASDYQMAEHVSFINRVRDAMVYTPYIQSVLFVNQKREVSFYVGSGSAFVKDEKHVFLDKMNAEKESIFAWSAPNYIFDGEDVPLLSIVYPRLNAANDIFEGVVEVNIDAKVLSRKLFSGEKDESLDIFIINRDGIVVAHSNEMYCGEDWGDVEFIRKIIQGENRFDVKLEEELREINWIASSQPGFYIVGELDFGDRVDERLVMPVLLLAFFLIVLFAGLLFKVILNPLTLIILNMRQTGYINEIALDETSFLQRYHEDMMSRLEFLRIKEEKNIIIKKLMVGNTEEIGGESFWHRYGIKDGQGYYLVLLYFMGQMEEQDGLYSYELQKGLIHNICRDIFGTVGGSIDFEISVRSVLFLVYEDSNRNCENLQELMLGKKAEIEAIYKDSVIACVSEKGLWGKSDIKQLYRTINGHIRTGRLLEQAQRLNIVSSKNKISVDKKT